MTDEKRSTTTSARHIVWAIALTVPVCAALTSWPAAQQGSGERRSKLIEQFEKGEAASGNEHWRTVSLEHNPFMLDDLEAALNEHEAQRAVRHRDREQLKHRS